MSEENSPLRPWIDPEIEARIVALVLGETSDFEREELERLIAANHDLAEYRKRIEAAHGLLGDIVKEDSSVAEHRDWSLPESMQADLLAAFERETDSKTTAVESPAPPAESPATEAAAAAVTVADQDSDALATAQPAVTVPGLQRSDASRWRKILAIAALVAAMAVIGGMMMPLASRRPDFGLLREDLETSDYASNADQRGYGTPPPIISVVEPTNLATTLASARGSESDRRVSASGESNERARAALLAMNEDFGFEVPGERRSAQQAPSGYAGIEAAPTSTPLYVEPSFDRDVRFSRQLGTDVAVTDEKQIQRSQSIENYSRFRNGESGKSRDLGRLSELDTAQTEGESGAGLEMPALADAEGVPREDALYWKGRIETEELQRHPETARDFAEDGGDKFAQAQSQEDGGGNSKGLERAGDKRQVGDEFAETLVNGVADMDLASLSVDSDPQADAKAPADLNFVAPTQSDGREKSTDEAEALPKRRPPVALSKKFADMDGADGAAAAAMGPANEEGRRAERLDRLADTQSLMGDLDGEVAPSVDGNALVRRSSGAVRIAAREEEMAASTEADAIPATGVVPVTGMLFSQDGARPGEEASEGEEAGAEMEFERTRGIRVAPSADRKLKELSRLAAGKDIAPSERADEHMAQVEEALGEQILSLNDSIVPPASGAAPSTRDNLDLAYVAEAQTGAGGSGGGGMGGGAAGGNASKGRPTGGTETSRSNFRGQPGAIVTWMADGSTQLGEISSEVAAKAGEESNVTVGGNLVANGGTNGGTITVEPAAESKDSYDRSGVWFFGAIPDGARAPAKGKATASPEAPNASEPQSLALMESRFGTRESSAKTWDIERDSSERGRMAPTPGQNPAPGAKAAATPDAPQPFALKAPVVIDGNLESDDVALRRGTTGMPENLPALSHFGRPSTDDDGLVQKRKSQKVDVGSRFGLTEVNAAKIAVQDQGVGLGFIEISGKADRRMEQSDDDLVEAVKDLADQNRPESVLFDPGAQPVKQVQEVKKKALREVESKLEQVAEMEKSVELNSTNESLANNLAITLERSPEVVEFDGFINYGQPIQPGTPPVHITTKFVEVDDREKDALGFDWLLQQPDSGAEAAARGDRVTALSAASSAQANPQAQSMDAKTSDYLLSSLAPAVQADKTASDSYWSFREAGEPDDHAVSRGFRSGSHAIAGDSIDGLVTYSGGFGAMNADGSLRGGVTTRHDVATDAPADPASAEGHVRMFAVTPASPTNFESAARDAFGIEREFIYPTEYDPPELPGGVDRSWAKKQKSEAPAELGETATADEPFSTFSLHVSDVSFKLAQAALANGEWPDAQRIRVEEFVNALDYGDPMPSQAEKVACQIEQSIHPFLQQRNLLRVSMRTAAVGRSGATPLRLTLLLDSSGSMERHDRQETVRRAIALLAGELQPSDQVTLIGFARTPRLLADRIAGDARQQLMNAVANTPSEGGTHLESALDLAFEKARELQSEGAQNRVILLTDGAANLGDADPDSLATKVVAMREAGIAFDAAGFGAEGLNDEILEALTRQGDGRYYLLDRPEDADEGFARQIAGALRPAAMNVKVQIEFNPDRVASYKLLGFEKHRLNKEDFRDDKVDAAEIAAEEAGVAVYQFEPLADGEGDVGTAFLRFRDMASGEMVEKSWPIPYAPDAPRPEQAAPAVRLASVAALFAAKLKGDALGESVDLGDLTQLLAGLPEPMANLERVTQLRQMIEQARNLEGQ